MSLGAQLRHRQAFLLRPGTSEAPHEAGLWILDLAGLDKSGCQNEIRVRTRQAQEHGAELRFLSAQEIWGHPVTVDLAQLLRGGLQGLDLRITIPSRQQYIPSVRRFLAGRIGDRFGAKAAFHMELVLDELCHNAIEHGAPFPSVVEIEISADVSVVRYSISNAHVGEAERDTSMRDRLERFDASGQYLEERGRGLFLVGRMMDGMTIDSHNGRIWVRTWKDLSSLAG